MVAAYEQKLVFFLFFFHFSKRTASVNVRNEAFDGGCPLRGQVKLVEPCKKIRMNKYE